MKRQIGARQDGERGQSMVEFALMLVILLTILMGVLDLGRAYFAYIALQDAVAEGAAYAAVNPTCLTPGPGACADPDNVIWRTHNESPAGMVTSSSMQVQVLAADLTPGSTVTVSATYTQTLLTFVISSIVGSNQLPLQAQANSIIQ